MIKLLPLLDKQEIAIPRHKYPQIRGEMSRNLLRACVFGYNVKPINNILCETYNVDIDGWSRWVMGLQEQKGLKFRLQQYHYY